MGGNRRRDTKPELALRRELHRRGFRYRVDSRPLPTLMRRADLVFPRERVAVFVDGCFWHRCPNHGTSPRSNSQYWSVKLDRNAARDKETDSVLTSAGWRVVRVWEHEDCGFGADRVVMELQSRRRSRGL